MATRKRRSQEEIKQLLQAENQRRYRVLLPLSSLAEAQVLLPFAEALIREQDGQLVILQVEIVPEGHPLSEAAARASRTRQAFGRLLDEFGLDSAQVKTVVRVAHEVWEGIWETVEQEQIELLVIARPSSSLPQTAVGDQNHARLAEPPCGVVAIEAGAVVSEQEGWGAVSRILVPLRSGEAIGLVLRLAQVLADIGQAEITLFHVTGQAPREVEEEWFPALSPALHGLERVTRSVTAKGDVAEAILAEAANHDVVILGAPYRQGLGDGWRGEIYSQLQGKLTATLLVAKAAAEAPEGVTYAAANTRAGRNQAVSVVVDKWFAENTFHSREFAALERLVNLKEEQGVSISLGLPALNEEETVGSVIEVIRSTLMERFPLLDEMVLIDSGSVDYTREIAADLGIPVYIHQQILPQYGGYTGKGEALWKSLYVLDGDIIAWIDTDIKNIHPRFVYGVLGPLLREPRIQYTKGFYRRPLIRGDKIVAGGGGRVTELTARPFINLFFPELSGVIQPLSGEYAGRREALERLPFFTGYGVETGLLIDFLREFGLRSIAQVDLLERIHHNQKLHSLSKMSFAIMQVVIKRLEQRHTIRLLDRANLTMNLIRYGPSRFYIDAVEIQERERPPMITIPEYRLRRGLEEVPEAYLPAAELDPHD